MITKTIFLLSVILTSIHAQAASIINPQQELSCFDHLVSINQEWNHYKDEVPTGHISFKSDEARIQLHLELVIDILRAETPANLSNSQHRNRLSLLNDLSAYANRKIFPINTMYNHRQPCFVDEKNTHCAVGYMMATSGENELVAEIVQDYNYDYLRNIETPGINQWADENGFTLDELKWIQPGYPPAQQYEPLANGTNGPVTSLINTDANNFIFSGTFSEVDDLPCYNVGKYEDNTLTCLGGGVQGTVNGLINTLDGIYAFGELNYMGESYPLALFTDGFWHYESIPSISEAIVTAGHRGVGSYKMELAITRPGYSGQEIWYNHLDGFWQKKASLNGTIYDIERSSYGHVFAGHFSTITTFDEEGVATESTTNNMILKHDFLDEWTSIMDPVSDTIKCVKSIGTVVYIGGSANLFTESDICLSRYALGEIQPLILKSTFPMTDHISINDINRYSDSGLILVGEINMPAMGVGTFGRHIAKYSVLYNFLEPLALFNKQVNSVYRTPDGILYVAGDFDGNIYGPSLNHLARLKTSVGIDEFDAKPTLKIYPNPFIGKVTISGLEGNADYQIMDQLGRVIKHGIISSQSISDLDDIPAGNYILVVRTANNKWTIKLIK